MERISCVPKKIDGIASFRNAFPIARYISSETGVRILDVNLDRHEDSEPDYTVNENIDGMNILLIGYHRPEEKKEASDIEYPAPRVGKNITKMQWAASLLQNEYAREDTFGSAASIEFLGPYIGLGRLHRYSKNEGPLLKPISAGINSVIDFTTTFDFHAHRKPKISRKWAHAYHPIKEEQEIVPEWGFYIRSLSMMPHIIKAAINEYDLKNPIIISPDEGGSGMIELFGGKTASKQRFNDMEVDVTLPDTEEINYSGRDVIIGDDMVATLGTAMQASRSVKNKGASRVIVGGTHRTCKLYHLMRGLRSHDIDGLVISNSIGFPKNIPKDTMRSIKEERFSDKLTILDVAPILAHYVKEHPQEMTREFWSQVKDYTKLPLEQTLHPEEMQPL